MAYSTQTDVELAAGGAAKLVELADQDGDGSLDTSAVEQAIADADALINSYAQRRNAVPYSPVPDIIRRYSAREAVYQLKVARGCVTELDQARHEELVKWLELLAKGHVTVGIEPEPAASSAHVAEESDRETEVANDSGKVSRESLKGFW